MADARTLLATQPIVRPNGIMLDWFRDYLLNLVILPRIDNITDATYTMQRADIGKVKRFTGTSQTVTIPPNVFATRDVITIRQSGPGTLSLVTTGLAINGSVSWSQNTEKSFRCVGTNNFDVV